MGSGHLLHCPIGTLCGLALHSAGAVKCSHKLFLEALQKVQRHGSQALAVLSVYNYISQAPRVFRTLT